MDRPALPPPESSALFLDFDGTLVEIAGHPEAVVMSGDMVATLARLIARMDGAFAIVTGRDIAAIDRFLAPLIVPVAGIHGLTRRDSSRRLHPPPSGTEPFIAEAWQQLSSLAVREDGLFIERKTAGIALHYRQRPDLEQECVASMEAIADRYPGIEVKRGKMVVEAKPGHMHKGTAIMDFMAEAPFLGRRPIFAGDDVTDEDAFRVVNELNGITIKIGEGPTQARYRLPSTTALHAWLACLLNASGEQEEL